MKRNFSFLALFLVTLILGGSEGKEFTRRVSHRLTESRTDLKVSKKRGEFKIAKNSFALKISCFAPSLSSSQTARCLIISERRVQRCARHGFEPTISLFQRKPSATI